MVAVLAWLGLASSALSRSPAALGCLLVFRRLGRGALCADAVEEDGGGFVGGILGDEVAPEGFGREPDSGRIRAATRRSRPPRSTLSWSPVRRDSPRLYSMNPLVRRGSQRPASASPCGFPRLNPVPCLAEDGPEGLRPS